MTAFLRWLESQPQGEANLGAILDWPTDVNKLSGVVRGLEQLGLVIRRQTSVAISDIGRRFCNSEIREKMARMREIFLDVVPVKRITELLERSFYGRLPRRVVADSFRETFGSQVTDAEVQGFINWAHESELFQYDKDRAEIVSIQLLSSKFGT